MTEGYKEFIDQRAITHPNEPVISEDEYVGYVQWVLSRISLKPVNSGIEVMTINERAVSK